MRRGRPLGQAAALTLAGPLMRYCDFASTHAAHAYVEYQQYMVADADRERRDLLEHLLAGSMPTPRAARWRPRRRTASRRTPRMLVATAVTVGRARGRRRAARGSAAIACAGLHGAKTLVVVRQAEIVAILVLGPGADPVRLCDRVDVLQSRLRAEGIVLAMGVSTVAAGTADMPRAYQEARTPCRRRPEDGGVAALARLTPFDYLALRADDTARRLVDPRLRAFLAEDRRRGGVLTETIRAFADADLNLRACAPSACRSTPTPPSTACAGSRSAPDAIRAGSPTSSTCSSRSRWRTRWRRRPDPRACDRHPAPVSVGPEAHEQSGEHHRVARRHRRARGGRLSPRRARRGARREARAACASAAGRSSTPPSRGS